MMSIQHLLVVLLLSINLLHPANAQNTIPALNDWTTKLEASFSIFREFMKLDALTPTATSYPTSTYNDASAQSLLDGIVTDMQTKLVTGKEGIVEELRKATETYYKDSVESTAIHCTNFTYDRAKAITSNQTAAAAPSTTDKCQRFNYVNLTDNPLLYNVAVTYNTSTAHVPTNVFDGSRSILMVANWSRDLNTDFTANAQKDVSVKWQYFGSAEGMLKIYPGVKWYVQINQIGSQYPVDFFDCRSLPWYLMASACPKSVVLVVDKSGSMTGKRVIIANRTVTEILLTLTENDYFNVVHIDGFASVIDPAYNESLIQASRRNVHRVINLLNNEAKLIANYSKGLRRGLDLLETSPPGYAKALFVIGDGLPYPFIELIPDKAKYNFTRIFAYLIGKEATEVENMRNMACNNNGFYAHIMTLSDVKENVLKYLPVISRVAVDLETSIPRFSAWTGPHVREILGRAYRMPVTTTDNATNITTTTPARILEPNSLFLTVAKAAYNTKPKVGDSNRNFFPLLGALGVDIPVTDFERLTKKWLLGASGYVFMTNNNGYVIFHPNFRPTYNGHMKPFYQNTDLERAEHPINAVAVNGHPAFNATIREDMIKRSSGNAESKVYNVPDDFKSAFEITNKYFFKPLPNTPYSIAVVLPWPSAGSSDPYLQTPADSSTTSFVIEDFAPWLKSGCPNATTTNGSTIVPYDFCTFDEAVATQFFKDPICALKEVIDKNSWKSDQSCDKDYIKLIQRDAHQSKNIHNDWNTDSSKSQWTRYDIDLAFLLFHTGLLKYYNKTIPRDTTFIAKHKTRAMHDDLFQTTFMYARTYNEKDLLYFHVPSPTEFNINSSITVTGMVFVKDTTVPVAVSGLQLSFEKLKAIFEDTTSTVTGCTGDACLNCTDSNVDCYLLSTNGFIIASNGNASDTGKFLGSVDDAVMLSMLENEKFSQKLVYDFQGICNSSTGITSFATRLIDPIASFLYSVVNVIVSVSIVIFQSFLTLFWAAVSMAEVNPTYNVSGTPAWNSCSYSHNIFSWNLTATPKSYTINSTQCQSNCTKRWTAQRIAKTNLILLYVHSSDLYCPCLYGTVADSMELEMNRSQLINKTQSPPNWKCDDTPKTETGAVCDGANNLRIPNVAVTIGISVFVTLLRHYG